MVNFEILIIFFILNLFLVINFEKINFFQIIIDKPDKFRKFHKKRGSISRRNNSFYKYYFLLTYFLT